MRFTRWRVEWNGCGETWPGGQPLACWGQSAGGYGDGVGCGETRGRWIIEESSFLNNTSDGLDLLYVRPGGSIEIRRTVARGNAGNQIKTSGPSLIENSVIVGNCGWFNGNAVTFNVDDCRATGNALAMFLFRGDHASVVNSTIASEGDCVMIAFCAEGSTCDGSERLTLRNNIFIGAQEFLDPTDRSCALYSEGLGSQVIDPDYTIVFGAKIDDGCRGIHDFCNVDPLLTRDDIDDFDGQLRSGSPAIGAALPDVAPQVDFAGRRRDARPDIGAYEHGEQPRRARPVRRP
jgi:hypothetical protein